MSGGTLNFPSSPNTNDTYSFGGKTWTYNGSAWKLNSTALTTTTIAEGSNLYFTNARSRAAISVAGSGSYDSATGVITVTGGVTSVNGQSGAVTGFADTANGLSQFASTTSAQLATVISDETGTGNLVFSVSPALTGVPTAPTAANNVSSTQIATTEFVKYAVANLVDGAPALLDTLNELAAAINDDASFSVSIANTISTAQTTANNAFDKANTAYVAGTAGFDKANTAALAGTAGFDKANTAYVAAVAAFDSGNTKVATVAGVTSTSISNAQIASGISSSGILTTANVSELTNQYFTNARSRGAISVTGAGTYDSGTGVITITGGVTSVGGATGAVSNAQLASGITTSGVLNTSNVAEGANLYFTTSRARASIDAAAGGPITYSAASGNVALSTSGVSASTYGGASKVPVFTVDTYGRITSAANVSVAGVSSFSASGNTFTIGTADGGSFAASIQPDSVQLGRDTTGAYVGNLVAGTGISISNLGNEGATPTITNEGVTSVNGSAGAITNVAKTTDKLSTFAATTSTELRSVISDETGTGNLVFSNSPVLVTPDLGTPSAINLANATGLSVSTGVSGLASGVATFLGAPTSANLRSAVTDETGSGSLVFSDSPVLITPNIGAPSYANLTNATGLPVSTGISGLGSGVSAFLATPTSANLAAAVTDETGTGGLLFANSPAMLTPNIDTPSYAKLTNATGLPVSTGISGLGAGVATFLATPSSANLAGALTDESGTNTVAFTNSPVLVTPNIGVPSYAVLSNATGLPLSSGISGLGTGQTTLLGGAAATGVTANTYGGSSKVPVFTVDQYGRITSASNVAAASGVSSFTASGNTFTIVTADGTFNAGIQADSVQLGRDTTGVYVGNLVAGTGVTLTNLAGENATPTIAIGQAVGTTADVTFNTVSTTGNVSVGGSLNVTGNLNVYGTTTTFNSNVVEVADSIIYLASGNSGDVVDIGFTGHFTSNVSGYQHTGLVRHAEDGEWKLFANVATEPSNNTLNFTNATYSPIRVGALTATSGAFTGNVSFANIVSTGTSTSGNFQTTGNVDANNLKVTTNSSLGTVVSGTWNGSEIGTAYTAAKVTSVNGQTGAATGFATTANSLSQFASTTSAQLATLISDETGSGALVFGTSPVLTTPNIGTPSYAVLTSATGLPVSTGISGLGAGVAAFLATPSSANLATAVTDETGTGTLLFSNSPVMTTPNIGTPSYAVLTSATGLPVSTGISGLGTGVATFLAATPTSSALATLITDETGTGNLVFSNSPVLVTPNLGTPSAINLANATNLPISSGIGGLGANVSTFLADPTSAKLAFAITDETGSGNVVFNNSPTLVTPILGTPQSVTLTNATGLPVSTGISGLGNNISTFLATPTSANLAGAVTDETGSGALVFATSPTLVTPNIGAPSYATLTNATGLPISTGVSGLGGNVATLLGLEAKTGVTATTYGSALNIPVITVDAYGRISSASNVALVSGVSSVGGATGSVSNAQLASAITSSGVLNTSNVAEGTNLYFSNTRSRQALSAGTGISYDNSTGVITSTITQNNFGTADARSAISVSGKGSYDSGTGVITVSAAQVTVSSTPPGSPYVGDTWIDDATGSTYIYFNDGTSSQWVEQGGGTTISSLVSSVAGATGDISNATIASALTGQTVSVGNLTVTGTLTAIQSTTLDINDKNITLAKGAGSSAGADGAGITIDGAGATLNYVHATTAFTSSQDIDLASGKALKINGTSVLSGSTLGSGITGSSLTSVGTIGTGTWNGSSISTTYTDAKVTSVAGVAGAVSNAQIASGLSGQSIDHLASLVVDGGSSTYGNVITTQFGSVFATANNSNPYSIMQVRSSDGTSGIGIQAYAGVNSKIYSNSGFTFVTGGTIRDRDFSTGGTSRATLDSTGLSVTGNVDGTSGRISGNFSTTGVLRVSDTTPATAASTGAVIISGGASVGNNLYVGGNLYVAGTTTTLNSNVLTIDDPIIYLADNSTTDILDLGFIASFNNGTQQHTGFIRDASDGVYKLFANVIAEPNVNGTVDFTNATYSALTMGALTASTGTFSGNVNPAAGLVTGNFTAGNFQSAGNVNAASILTTGSSTAGTFQTSGNVNANNLRVTTNSTVGTVVSGTWNGASIGTAYTDAKIVAVSNTAPVSVTTSSGTATVGLLASGVTAASYGNATLIPSFTVDTYGRITAASNVSITTGTAITDDTTTNSTRYLPFTSATSGSISAANVSSTKLFFNPSTGLLTSTDYNSSSDKRLKKNIKTVTGALDTVDALRGVSFEWKEGGAKAIGMIAQEVQEVIPDVVTTDDNGYLGIKYTNMVGVLVEAIKELKAEFEAYKKTHP